MLHQPGYRAVGSPAYAGIDRMVRIRGRGNAGFPRIRGDRPTPSALGLVVSRVPPHTRG